MSPRVWFITGANSGLGQALAEYCLSRGDTVIPTARDLSKLPATLSKASNSTPLKLDLAAPVAEIRAAVASVLERHPTIDVLVNNAGSCYTTSVAAADDEGSKLQFTTNVFGPLELTRALLPTLRSSKGTVLNVTSIAAFAGGGGFGLYNASKAALEAASEALAAEEKELTVRIIVPGYFPTPFWRGAEKNGGESMVKMYEQKHKDIGQAGDVNKAATRMWELVDGSGLGAAAASGRKLFLGPDCGERMRAKLAEITKQLESTEEVWRSTDL